MVRSQRWWTIGFLAVPLTVYLLIVVAPLLYSFVYSLTDWNGLSPQVHFVGLENFRKAFRDPAFANAVKNTLIWTMAAVAVPTTVGLGLALLLQEQVRGAKFFKSVFFLPVCLSLVVIGQTWIWIYQPDWGLLNLTLRGLGMEEAARAWLADPETALFAIIAAASWQMTGLAMVIFLAGLTSVPGELMEAAQIDGANQWQSLRYITIPMLRPASIVVMALAVINALKSFDIVYTMTKGGPFRSSETLAVFMYVQSFERYYMGYGSAVAVVLFLITLVVIALYFRQVRALERIYG